MEYVETGALEMIDLCSLPGIGPGIAKRIERMWPEDRERDLMLLAHPYQLTKCGIGFSTADKVALHLGMDPKSPVRAVAATLYGMLTMLSRGGSGDRVC